MARDVERVLGLGTIAGGRAIRTGFAAGDTTEQIVTRIRGTQANNFADGIMQASRNQARTLVRSQVQTIANQAREEAFKENAELIAGVQWVATLDSRTTIICANLDGKVWKLDTKEPIGHSFAWPGPTAHMNCRSTQISVLKSFDQLQKGTDADVEARFKRKLGARWDGDEKLQRRVDRDAYIARNFANARASMDGQVAATMKFPEWLRKKDREQRGFADRVLGKERAMLWRKGQLSFPQMVDQTNRPLSLEQIKKRVK